MNMDSLPVEVIIAIGRFLTRPALIASLQVCKRWHLILHPLLWRFIRIKHWHHPAFPLREERLVTTTITTAEATAEATAGTEAQVEAEEALVLPTALDDLRLASLLVNVFSMEWRDMSIIEGVPRREAKRRSPLPLETIERTVGLASNLVVLSLSFKYSMKTDTLPALVATLHGLAHLKELSLFMKVETDAPMDIEDLFFVFSRLDKLSVGGTWIANERQQYQENIEPGTGAGGELQESPQSWKVKELMVNTRLLSLARHCPSLRRLSTTHADHTMPTGEMVPYSLCHFSRCLQLQDLSLPHLPAMGISLDTATFLPAFGMIKSLSLSLTKLEDVEFLNSSTGFLTAAGNTTNNNDGSQQTTEGRTLYGGLVLPMLDTLSIVSARVAPAYRDRLQLALRQFFMSRTRLKWIYFGSLCIDPLHVFAQPGMELEHRWACTNLETITFKLCGFSPYIRLATEKQRDLMSSAYRQLGCLPRLQSLSIECDSKFALHDPAILQLKGATALWKLSLTLVKGWTREGIATLVDAVPGLRVLTLSLVPSGENLVEGWLKELGRPDVALRRC